MSKSNNEQREDKAEEITMHHQIKQLIFQLDSRIKDNEENKGMIESLKKRILLMDKEMAELKLLSVNNFKKDKFMENLNEKCRKLEGEIVSLQEIINQNEKKYSEEKTFLVKQYEEKLTRMKLTIESYTSKIETVSSLEKINETHENYIKELEKKFSNLEKEYKLKSDQRKLKQVVKFSDLKKKMMENIEYTQKNVEQLNVHHMDTSTKLILMQNSQLLIEIEYLKKLLEETNKIKEGLERKIDEMIKSTEIFESVSSTLAEKNKKQADSIKKLNEKIAQLTCQLETLDEKPFVDRNFNESSICNFYNEMNSDQPSSSKRYSCSNNASIINWKDKSKLTKQNSSVSLNKSKEIFQNLKDFQTTISLDKKIQNLLSTLEEKKKDYEILNLKYETLKEKLNMYEKKNQGLLKLFQEGLNRLTLNKDILGKITEENNIDTDKIKDFDFDQMNKDQKYFILTFLINSITPNLNLSLSLKDINETTVSNNLVRRYHFNANSKELDRIEKRMNLTRKQRSMIGFPESQILKIEYPKINNKDYRFIIPNKCSIINNPGFTN